MSFDFAAAKEQSRRIVHNTFAVAATYQSSGAAAPVDLRVRWHNRIANTEAPETGQLARQLAAEIEGPEKIVFDREELAAKGVMLARTGIVIIPAYGVRFTLESSEPTTGPIDIVWVVVR